MAEGTEIAWTDNTFNPWWGCTKVSPGCDNCYAEAWDKRFGGNHWGKGNNPRTMSEQNWNKPIRWNKESDPNNPTKVFCGSMCDVFDKNAPEEQRERLWQLIRDTPNLIWQLLTKRAPNIQKYLPEDWGEGYPNVWLGVTCEDNKHGLPRVEQLRLIPAKVRFLSCEPMLEEIHFKNLEGIHWVIGGGESGNYSRILRLPWVDRLHDYCDMYEVPFFFKQWGGAAKDKGGCLLYGKEHKEWPLIK